MLCQFARSLCRHQRSRLRHFCWAIDLNSDTSSLASEQQHSRNHRKLASKQSSLQRSRGCVGSDVSELCRPARLRSLQSCSRGMRFRAQVVNTENHPPSSTSQTTPTSPELRASTSGERRGRTSVLLLVSVLSSISAATRDPQQSAVPTFQSGTELVSVPVVVKDHRGNRVHALTLNDFRIYENGHQVPIYSFAAPTAESNPATSAGTPAVRPTPSPRDIAPTPIILFFDQLNTPASEQTEVRRRLVAWYHNQSSLPAPTCVVLYTGWSLRILQQPTLDATKVLSAIDNISTTVNSQGAGATGELPLPAGANENLAIGTGDGPLRSISRWEYFWHRDAGSSDTQSALIAVGKLFAAWPGEKALIWVSAGPTQPVWTAPLQAMEVKLYPIHVHTSVPYEFVASFTTPLTTYSYETDVNSQLLRNLREAALETGGELCFNSEDPRSCVQKALQDATDHYVLTYQTHSHSSQPEWRQIQVKVERPGITVSSRNGVLIAPSLKGGEKKREQITAALASPIDLPGLRLDFRAVPPRQSGQELLLSVVMLSDANRPGVWNRDGTDITIACVVLRGTDVIEQFGEDIHGPLSPNTVGLLEASGLTWTHKIAPPEDATAVRLVVRDNATGRIGSVTRTLR